MSKSRACKGSKNDFMIFASLEFSVSNVVPPFPDTIGSTEDDEAPAVDPDVSDVTVFSSSKLNWAALAAFAAARVFSASSASDWAASLIASACFCSAVPSDCAPNAENRALAISVSDVTIWFNVCTRGVSTCIRPWPITDINSFQFSVRIRVWFAQLSEVLAKSPCASASCSVTKAYLSCTSSACVMADMLFRMPF